MGNKKLPLFDLRLALVVKITCLIDLANDYKVLSNFFFSDFTNLSESLKPIKS